MASVQISTFNVQYFSLFYGNSSEYFNRKNVEETDKSFTDSCSHSNSLESEQCDKWLVEMSGDNLKYCLSRTIKMVTYCKIMFEHVKLLKYIGSIRLCVCLCVGSRCFRTMSRVVLLSSISLAFFFLIVVNSDSVTLIFSGRWNIIKLFCLHSITKYILGKSL